jgi:hypothetical protein
VNSFWRCITIQNQLYANEFPDAYPSAIGPFLFQNVVLVTGCRIQPPAYLQHHSTKVLPKATATKEKKVISYKLFSRGSLEKKYVDKELKLGKKKSKQ